MFMTAMGMAILSVVTSPVAGEVVELSGQLSVQRTSGATMQVSESGTAIHVGDELETLANSRVTIMLKPKSIVTLGPKSKLVIDESMVDDGVFSTAVNLVKGRLRALVGSIFGRKVRFDAKTPNAVAGVRGTYFFAETDGSESSFHSLNGKLSIKHAGGQQKIIDSGQSIQVMQKGFSGISPFSGTQLTKLLQLTSLPVRLPPRTVRKLVNQNLRRPAPIKVPARPQATGGQTANALDLESPPPIEAAQGVDVFLEFPQ